jgi:hypothetical protein
MRIRNRNTDSEIPADVAYYLVVKYLGEDSKQDFAEDARQLLNVIHLVGDSRGLGTSVKVVLYC